MHDFILPMQGIKKLCFDDRMCLSASSTDDNKSLEMFYGIVPKEGEGERHFK